MLNNGGGWGTQVGMAAMLRERGYLLEEQRPRQRREAPGRRRAARARRWSVTRAVFSRM